jgi:two-component system CheB/CheR fusion protein
VNSELHNKIEALSSAYQTITDVLNSTRIAVVFLDKDLKVKRFTEEATRVMNLIKSDIGRPVIHIAPNFEYEDLYRSIREVLDNLAFKEDEVRTKDGHWYLMRIMPYRSHKDKIDGAVLTFINIDAFKENQAEMKKMKAREKASRGKRNNDR